MTVASIYLPSGHVWSYPLPATQDGGQQAMAAVNSYPSEHSPQSLKDFITGLFYCRGGLENG